MSYFSQLIQQTGITFNEERDVRSSHPQFDGDRGDSESNQFNQDIEPSESVDIFSDRTTEPWQESRPIVTEIDRDNADVNFAKNPPLGRENPSPMIEQKGDSLSSKIEIVSNDLLITGEPQKTKNIVTENSIERLPTEDYQTGQTNQLTKSDRLTSPNPETHQNLTLFASESEQINREEVNLPLTKSATKGDFTREIGKENSTQTYGSYLQAVREWVAKPPETNQPENLQKFNINNQEKSQPFVNQSTEQIRQNPFSPEAADPRQSKPAENSNLSISIGTISLIIEEPQKEKQRQRNSSAKSEQINPIDRHNSRLSRHYIRSR